jgi:hypothetical protein
VGASLVSRGGCAPCSGSGGTSPSMGSRGRFLSLRPRSSGRRAREQFIGHRQHSSFDGDQLAASHQVPRSEEPTRRARDGGTYGGGRPVSE